MHKSESKVYILSQFMLKTRENFEKWGQENNLNLKRKRLADIFSLHIDTC